MILVPPPRGCLPRDGALPWQSGQTAALAYLIRKLFTADARIDDQIDAGRYLGWAGPRRKWRMRRRYSAKVLAVIEKKLHEWKPGVSSTR